MSYHFTTIAPNPSAPRADTPAPAAGGFWRYTEVGRETRAWLGLGPAPESGEPEPGKDRRKPMARDTRLAPWGVKKVLTYIEAHYGSSVDIETLSALVRQSCSHFTRCCKNTFGLPPHALVTRYRIERAQALMRSTCEPLSQVACACGFADQAHFCRTFRQWIGQTPGAWRREARRTAPLAA